MKFDVLFLHYQLRCGEKCGYGRNNGESHHFVVKEEIGRVTVQKIKIIVFETAVIGIDPHYERENAKYNGNGEQYHDTERQSVAAEGSGFRRGFILPGVSVFRVRGHIACLILSEKWYYYQVYHKYT